MEDARTRDERKFRATKSVDGTFTPTIGRETAARIYEHCQRTEQNKTRFVEWCVNKCIDDLEKQYLFEMTKEELIDLLLKKGER